MLFSKIKFSRKFLNLQFSEAVLTVCWGGVLFQLILRVAEDDSSDVLLAAQACKDDQSVVAGLELIALFWRKQSLLLSGNLLGTSLSMSFLWKKIVRNGGKSSARSLRMMMGSSETVTLPGLIFFEKLIHPGPTGPRIDWQVVCWVCSTCPVNRYTFSHSPLEV